MFVLLLAGSGFLHAQEIVARKEMEPRKLAGNYMLEPMGKNGVIVTTADYSLLAGRVNSLDFIFLDEHFQEQGTKTIEIDGKWNRVKTVNDGERLFILLHKNSQDEYALIEANILSQDVFRYDFKIPVDKLSVVRFKVIGNYMMLCGDLKKESVAFHYRLSTKGDMRAQVVKVPAGQNFDIFELKADEEHDAFVIGIRETEKKKGYKIIYKSFAPDGTPRQEWHVYGKSAEDRQWVLSGGSIKLLPEGKAVITGVYGLKEQAARHGFFIALVNANNQIEFMRYQNFGELTSFLDHLGEKKRDRMQAKAQKKISAGRSVSWEGNLLVHPTVVQDGKYYAAIEGFNPIYQNKIASPTSVNRLKIGVPVKPGINRVNTLVGWQFTHLCVAVFDEKGQYQWDNSVDLTKTPGLQTSLQEQDDFVMMNEWLFTNPARKLAVSVDISKSRCKWSIDMSGRIVASYQELKKTGVFTPVPKITIRRLSADQDDVLVSTEITTDQKEDEVKNDNVNTVDFFHGPYLISWGQQKIKNEEEGKRKVFYINKILVPALKESFKDIKTD